MPRKLGTKKTGGRQPGTPNRKTQELINRCKELGADPFAVLCYYASRNWKALKLPAEFRTKRVDDKEVVDVESPFITSDMQIECAKELMQYMYAKKRAVDISAGEGEEDGFKIVIQDYSVKKNEGT